MDKETKGVSAAIRLLDRRPDPAYIEEWTELLSKSLVPEAAKGITVIVFRLGKEWLAIDSNVFDEVISERVVHRIPHKSNEVLKGLTNYQGTLKLCVNMHGFLDIDPAVAQHDTAHSHPKFKRMVVIQKDLEIWIFPVDDVQGVITFKTELLGNTPVTLTKSTTNYLRGVIRWKDVDVGYLDEELLFFGLKRNLL
jgi:chemotaxis-related protein WspD